MHGITIKEWSQVYPQHENPRQWFSNKGKTEYDGLMALMSHYKTVTDNIKGY